MIRFLFFSVFLGLLVAVGGCGAKSPLEGKNAQELSVLLSGSDPKLQLQASYALSKLKADARPALAALVEALKNKQSGVRQNAALALGNVGADSEEAVAALTEALEDSDWPVRRQAALALARIGPAARSAVPALQKLEKEDSDQGVRQAAQDALKKIGS